MKIKHMDQYSEAWWDARSGIPTASGCSKIITAKTAVISSTCQQYINELIAERRGLGDPPFESEWMLRGKEMEPEARAFFTFETGLEVEQVGIILNDDETAGASADALVLSNQHAGREELTPGMNKICESFDTEEKYIAGLEIKCPKPSTQIGYLRSKSLPDVYKQQVHFSLAVSGLPRWYWMAYHPELDPVIIIVEPDEYTEKVAKAVEQFNLLYYEALEELGYK